MNAFFIEPERWPHLPHDAGDNSVEAVLLDGAEAQHMLKVLRLKVGDEVWCTNGQGGQGVFALSRADKHKAWLRPLELEHRPRPPGGAVLAMGWTKSLRRGWLLEKAVELEAAGLWLWQAKHSQGKTPPEAKDTWRAQCIAGAKQSKNPWLPELNVLPGGARELAAAVPSFDRAFLLWEEPGHERLLTMADLQDEARMLFIVGPEGGFAPDEITTLQAAEAQAVSLGQRVLRWETAAMLCLGLAWWARQPSAFAPQGNTP